LLHGLLAASLLPTPTTTFVLLTIVTGSNWLAQITGAPSVNYGTAAMILAAASIQNPNYVPTNYQTFLVTIFLMIVHACMASLPTKRIAQVNSFGSTFNVIALLIVIIMIPVAVNREDQNLPRFSPSKEVWGDIYTGTDFPAGLGVLMSFVSVIWTMSGSCIFPRPSSHH